MASQTSPALSISSPKRRQAASDGKDIEKACQSVYPLYDVFIRKEKMLKKPKFELGKLMELHIEGSSSGKAAVGETGAKVERDDGYKPPVQESV